MILILVGVAVLAAAIHYLRAHRISSAAIAVVGVVTDVEVRTSNFSGSRRELYGPSIRYRHPFDGTERLLPPASYQDSVSEVGDEVVVMVDPSTGEARLPLPRPIPQLALPFVFAALMFALGTAELLE